MFQALQSKFITRVSELLLAINDTFIASTQYDRSISFYKVSQQLYFSMDLFKYAYKVSKIVIIEDQYNSQFF